MTRRLLAVLITVVGVAGVLAAASRAAERTDTVAFSRPGPLTGVRIDVDAGRIEVVAGEAGEVRVRRTRRWALAAPIVADRVTDGVLALSGRCRSLAAFDCTVDYLVEVPAEVSVRVRSDAGRIDVAGVVGAVDVHSDAGAIHLSRIAGPVKASTDAGGIDGDDLSPTTVEVSSGAGAVALTLARPPGRTDVRTGAGGIDVGLPEGTYRVDARSQAGQVEVSVVADPNSSRTVTARSDAGAIRIHRR